ncbi:MULTISPECIES: hypothetical protein [Gordonia]|uniref:hypothetical protein n=1 Tax=Gordonia TaxID=2053 RepID=UPI0007EC08FD|nr:hypothetical protein [Gordonia sp. 852002-50395_SCH5434458]OBC08820.1 hypothetical protein A5785_05540 [Gordonia sp. 852002-50395_SCH5434458]
MSAHGTFVRAFIEAETIAVLSGSAATGSYPGFAAANRTGRIPKYYSHGMPMWIYTGFSSHSVIRLDNTGPDTYTATVCTRESVNPLNKESVHFQTTWLTYHRHGTPPPPNQHGPRNAPSGDIFGDWYATKYVWDHNPEQTLCKDTPIDRSHTPTPGWPTTTGDL